MEIHSLVKLVFISQRKFVMDMLHKFHMESNNLVDTPLVQNFNLSMEEKEIDIDARHYRSLMGSLLYLTTSKLNIMYKVNCTETLNDG